MKNILKAAMMTTMAMAAFGADPMAALNVPFSFTVGNKTMPAGRYRISVNASGPNAMRIENLGKGPSAFMALPVRDLTAPDETRRRVEFACEAESCSISRVFNLHGGYVYSTLKKAGSTGKHVALQMTTGNKQVE